MQEEAEIEVEDLVLPSSDCQNMLDQIVAETSMRTRLEAERAFMNQCIVDQAYTATKSITKAHASAISSSKVSRLYSLIKLPGLEDMVSC